ncbi:hypothetical protein [Nocardiopsis valliformis]|uniref:hypothetical protein n=1 Tax=Nocardiopsis valliformis TaxID=239974 RepID=UPI00034BB17F|nr:hypothetical protein [Nocardiopsis valliformis]
MSSTRTLSTVPTVGPLTVPLTALLMAALVLLCAAPAHAEPESPRSSPSEYYAGLLAAEPEGAAVVVDDALAGDYDVAELEASLHEAFGRLDTPYYVLASPFPGVATSADDFLAAVQDRVGRPGVYVYLRPTGSSTHAIPRQVDVPVDRAATMLSLERVVTLYTPIDAKAHALVDMALDPELNERYAAGYTGGWYVLGPISWWLDHRIQALKLNTVDGPARLGETAGLVLGMTVTLAVAFGAIRSGRRKRAARAGFTGRPPGDRALLSARFAAPAIGVVVMAASLIHLNTATLPRDEEQVGELPPATPPYVADTVRVDRITEGLREDPLYLDPLAGQSAEDLAPVAERLAEAEFPLYVAVVPMSRHDESGGDPEILAHALHHVMGEDGVFLVLDSVENSSSSVELEAALFGYGFADEEQEWEQGRVLRQVTGYQSDTTAARALDRFLDAVAEVSATPGQSVEEPRLASSRAEPFPERSRLSDFASGDFFPRLIFAGPLAALLILVLAGAWLRFLNRMRSVPGRALRPRADRAVRRAVKALQADPTHRGRTDALRETDAALAVLAGNPDELDLVGVTVLAERAVLRLDPDPATAALADGPVCMVNPLHGPSALHGDDRDQPLCASCAALTGAERTRRTLRVAAPDGGRLPHLELSRWWTATGYGARGRLDVENLLKESNVR